MDWYKLKLNLPGKFSVESQYQILSISVEYFRRRMGRYNFPIIRSCY